MYVSMLADTVQVFETLLIFLHYLLPNLVILIGVSSSMLIPSFDHFSRAFLVFFVLNCETQSFT